MILSFTKINKDKEAVTVNFKFTAEIAVLGVKTCFFGKTTFFRKKYTVFQTI